MTYGQSSLVLALLLATGCPGAIDVPKAAPAPAEPDGPRFDVAVEAPKTAIAGRPQQARIEIAPRAPWHMNLDYSPKLRMQAVGGVEVDTRERRGPEAARFDADGLAFELPFVPRSKGKQRIAGELQFAVCGAEACAPQSVPVDFTVEVGCDTDSVC